MPATHESGLRNVKDAASEQATRVSISRRRCAGLSPYGEENHIRTGRNCSEVKKPFASGHGVNVKVSTRNILWGNDQWVPWALRRHYVPNSLHDASKLRHRRKDSNQITKARVSKNSRNFKNHQRYHLPTINPKTQDK